MCAAIVCTVTTIGYYAWMISAWIHLDDKPRRSWQMSDGRRQMANAPVRIPHEPMPIYAHYLELPRRECDSVLKINASQGANYVVKIIDVRNEDVVLTYFLPSGDTQEIEIPSGKFEIRYTSGSEWYGEKLMFGPEASYAKADRVFDFRPGSGYELTLYQVRNGNLRTSKIRKEDF